MADYFHALPVLLVVLLEVSLRTGGQIKLGGKDGVEKYTFKTPDLTDEESWSHFMPATMRCDACKVIAYQLRRKFKDFNKKNKQYKLKLPESEIIDLVESVCAAKTFENYGLKEVDGVNRLTGDGLEASKAMGVTSGGGKWPARLQQMCMQYVEESSEEDIYEMYVKEIKQRVTMETSLCLSEGVFGECIEVEGGPRNKLSPTSNKHDKQHPTSNKQDKQHPTSNKEEKRRKVEQDEL